MRGGGGGEPGLKLGDGVGGEGAGGEGGEGVLRGAGVGDAVGGGEDIGGGRVGGDFGGR